MHRLFGLADVRSLLAVVGLIVVVGSLLAVVGFVCVQGTDTLSTCDMIDNTAQGQCLVIEQEGDRKLQGSLK